MQSRFVDTNIFIEIFARKGLKSDKSKLLLKENQDLMTTSLVISEIEWVLRSAYLLDKLTVSRYMKKILASDMAIDNKKLLIDALEYYKSNSADWTDCVNMFLIKNKGVKEAYSYDLGLGKFKWIKRLEP
jgi:predicted nucleic-acid-binding protein